MLDEVRPRRERRVTRLLRELRIVRLERTSPWAWNEHTLLDLDWLGIRVEGDAFRIRTDELRLYPVGTGDTGAPVLPRLGSHFNDDSDPDDRFFVRRYGGGGEIRIRPEDFGVATAPLTQLSFRGSQELRTGRRQDRFLLDADELLAAYPLRVLRLETAPGVERAEGAEPGTVGATLFGRDHWVTVPADLPDHELVLRLFAAEWPGLKVQLPADGRFV